MPYGKNNLSYNISTLVAFILWVTAMLFSFWHQKSHLFAGLDGNYTLDMALRQFTSESPLTTVMIDWYQGIGDIFASFNARFFPGFYLVDLFQGSAVGLTLAYTTFALELFAGILIFSWAIGLSRTASLTAAIAVCVMMFPLYGYSLIYVTMVLSPHMAPRMAVSLIMAASIFKFGVSGRYNIIWALVFLLCLFWFLFAAPIAIVLAGPFVIVCWMSALLAAETRSERIAKGGLLVIPGLLLLISGPAAFLSGLYLQTAAAAFPQELQNDRATYFYASILFHGSRYTLTGPILVVTAILGSVLLFAVETNRRIRAVAITLFTYFCTRMVFATVVIEFDLWRGPSPLYFEFFVIPLYAIVSSAAIGHIFAILGRIRIRPIFEWFKPPMALVAGAAIVLILPFAGPSHPSFAPFPPNPTPVTEALVEQIALPPGAVFRGRAINMVGRSINGDVGWLSVHRLDIKLMKKTGNDHRIVGLHMFQIPGFFNYNSTITPAFYEFTTRLLARSGDIQMRSVSVLRNVNETILKALGIRFVLTDAEYIGNAELAVAFRIDDVQELYLYDLRAANIGDYSPVSVVARTDANEAIEYMQSEDFDPKNEAVIIGEFAFEKLVAAKNGTVSFSGNTAYFSASSTGRSLVVLPIEFSRCLEIVKSPDDVKLIRVNLMETGVLFTGDVHLTIAHRYGPFVNPECRITDFFDSRRLGIGTIARPAS